MILLSLGIVFALLVTIGLPIVAGIWINKRFGVSWRVITLGALGYFIVQALITLVYSGLAPLMENQSTQGLNGINENTLLGISMLMAALLGVLIRWAGMKFTKMPLTNLAAAYGIGLGYGGIESITRVGLPLLMTFFTMLRNTNPQASALEPEIVTQLEALWQVSPWVPLVGSVERITALVMHITITIIILRAFTHKNNLWLAAAFGLEVFSNGIILGFAQAGLAYGWVIVIAVGLMAGNLYILHRLNAFSLPLSKETSSLDA